MKTDKHTKTNKQTVKNKQALQTHKPNKQTLKTRKTYKNQRTHIKTLPRTFILRADRKPGTAARSSPKHKFFPEKESSFVGQQNPQTTSLLRPNFPRDLKKERREEKS